MINDLSLVLFLNRDFIFFIKIIVQHSKYNNSRLSHIASSNTRFKIFTHMSNTCRCVQIYFTLTRATPSETRFVNFTSVKENASILECSVNFGALTIRDNMVFNNT